ncbi:MAG: hypothetical protein HYX48_05890 [Chlamydiales bacterium]|nr:hypothetical protein [Chlamydiales bacterium]
METLNCSLEELRQAASKVLAAAVMELFPNTLLVSSHLTPHGFCYDFVFRVPFTSELLNLLEERMGQIVRERRPVKFLEMVPLSAAAYFNHNRQQVLAESAGESPAQLLTLFQMGEFTDLCAHPFTAEQCWDVKIFRLLSSSKKQRYRGEEVTRISGTAFFERSELKEFLKRRDEFPQRDHLIVGEEIDLFSSINGNLVWHARGEKVKKRLIDLWKEELALQNFECISTRSLGTDVTKNHSKYFLHRQKSHNRFVEFWVEDECDIEEWERGLLSPESQFVDRAHIFCGKDQLLNICISSLQIICKMLKILHFKSRFLLRFSCDEQSGEGDARRLLEEAMRALSIPFDVEESLKNETGPTVEVRIQDGMGQEWVGPFVGIDCRGLLTEATLVFSFFNSLERLIALVLENCAGELPLWLAPEQVRVIGVKEDEYAMEIFQLLREAGLEATLDTKDEKLAKRLHGAFSRKIPWVVVLGERERRAQLITVRSFSPENTEEMSIETFIQRLYQTSRTSSA